MKMTDASRTILGIALACGLVPQSVLAQSGGGQRAAEAPSGRLEEIVVTAQKRTENLQVTPLAISAITADTLEQRGTFDVSRLTAFVPNLTTTTTPGSTSTSTIAIRGLGNGDPILTSDAPVSIYLDGVVIGRQAGSIFDLVDLERIEVLRGPQGTLYGRNTIGGAVNLITVKPADEPGINQLLSFGNMNQWQTRTIIDTGEWGASGVRAKLGYVHREQDGYVDDINARGDRDPGAFETDAARIALSLDRGGAFRADYAFDYNERDGVPAAFQATIATPTVQRLWNASPGFGGRAPQVSPERLDSVFFDVSTVNSNKVEGHGLTLEFDLGADMVLRSLTGYREMRERSGWLPMDGQGGIRALTVSPAVFVPPYSFIPTGVQTVNLFTAGVSPRNQHQTSQELNLIGKVGERFDYVAGLFYFREKSSEYSQQFMYIALPAPFPPAAAPTRGTMDYTHESESHAAFAQATYDLTDRFSFTGGIRYTEDEKDLNQVAPFRRSLSRDFDNFNWSATLDFQLNDNVMTYAKVATGYKAGGMNARSINDGYEPEDLTSYELGAKSDLFDQRLRLNAAIFYVDHQDMQLQQFVAGSRGATSNTVNAGEAEYMGLELEIVAQLAEGLTFSGSYGYLDRDFKEFLLVDPVTNQIVDVADTAHFTYSSRDTANAALQYDLPRFDIGQVSARVEYNYRSKVYFQPSTIGTPFNESIPGAGRSLLDARLALSEVAVGATNLTFALWGRNLTDEEYRIHGIDFGALGYAGNVYGEPRSYGVDFSMRL